MSNPTFHTLGIDGDIIAYRAAASLERPIDWGDGLWTLHCNANEVIATVDEIIDGYKKKFNAERTIVALTDSGKTFRHDLNPSYKANRKKVRKPVCLKVVKDHLIKQYGAVIYPQLEADDVLGIKATSTDKSFLLVSVDKDFKSIPCTLWNPDTDVLTTISKGTADYYHLLQTLTGDATDGYAGCPKVGQVTAQKLIGEPRDIDVKELWPIVLNAYSKHGFQSDYVVLMARMARILRHTEYSLETNKIKLWNPPVYE